MRSFILFSLISLFALAGCGPADRIESVADAAIDQWQLYTIPDLNLSFAYPAGWYVHEALKALQITPNSQPVWSSFADPNQPNDGPYFDLLYNLNRQMAETPQEEVENILRGYDEEVEDIEPATPLVSRPDVVVGVYRFTAADDGMVLLVGAAANPLEDSPQPTIALVSVVKEDELATMKPIFEAILRSVSQVEQ